MAALRLKNEAIEQLFLAGCRDQEYRASVLLRASEGRRTVERAANVDERRLRIGPIWNSLKAVEHTLLAGGCDRINRTAGSRLRRSYRKACH
jgi:hypothetical protein